MGNRDINKMRFTSEYTDQELAKLSPESPAAYWVPETWKKRKTVKNRKNAVLMDQFGPKVTTEYNWFVTDLFYSLMLAAQL